MVASLTSPLLLQLLGAFRAGTALLVLAVPNPIHALLLLIRVFLLGTLLLFTLAREYFALLFLIVYVGAIVVLFLFLIRRLELKSINTTRRLRDLLAARPLLLALFFGEVLRLASEDSFDLSPFASFASSVSTPILTERNSVTDWSTTLVRIDTLRALGGLLYTEAAVTFLLAAALLFLARVGAIALTLPATSSAELATQLDNADSILPTSGRGLKRQDPQRQARRHPTLAVARVRNEV